MEPAIDLKVTEAHLVRIEELMNAIKAQFPEPVEDIDSFHESLHSEERQAFKDYLKSLSLEILGQLAALYWVGYGGQSCESAEDFHELVTHAIKSGQDTLPYYLGEKKYLAQDARKGLAKIKSLVKS